MYAPIPQLPIDSELLFRFVRGTASAEDCCVVDQWMAGDPDHRAHVEALIEMWGMTGALGNAGANTKTMWGKIRSQLETDPPRPSHSPVRPLTLVPTAPHRGWVMTAARVAAVVLVAVGLGVSALPRWRHRVPATTVVEGRQYIAPRGRRVTVHLSDGSIVTIAPGSTLRTRPQFGIEARDVVLEGEAYFDVTHDTHMPFRVRTVQGFAEDVGTKFSVRSYPSDITSRVVVAEGRVAVGRGVILDAGDIALVTATAAPDVQRGVPVAPLLSWTTGQLTFVKTPLRETLAELSRWYGVEVRMDDSVLARRTVTAVFHDESVSAVLESIARIIGARHEQHGTAHVLVSDRPGSRRIP